MSRIDCLINYYNELPEVIRLKELEPYYDNNKDIVRLLNDMDNLKMMMKESYKKENYIEYKKYKEEYYNKYQELLDIPFVEEFKELLDIIYNMLDTSSKIIENAIKDELK